MRYLQILTLCCVLAFATRSNFAPAAEPIESLLRYLPASANGLVVVRVKELLASPRAVREKWSENSGRFLAGADTIPHWVEVFVMGSQVHPGSDDGWTATVVPLPPPISLATLAKSENIAVVSLGGASAALSRDSYYLELAPQVLGVMSPAHRQDAARWARDARLATDPQLSPFLQQAVQLPGQIVMALDTQDMLDPSRVEARLKACVALRDQPDAIGSLRDAVVGMRGVTFRADIKEETEARITFVFADPLPSAAVALKDVFLEFLVDEHLMVPDLRESQARIDGKELLVSVTLSDPALRQIMSLVMAPYPAQPADVQATTEPPTKEDAAEERKRLNRGFYAAVQRALGDLQRSVKLSFTNPDLATQAGWVERAIGKIDYLSLKGVDPELAKYSAEVTAKLRAVSASLRGMAVSVNTAESTLTYRVEPRMVGGYYRGRRGWGASIAPTYNVQSNLAEVRKEQAAAVTSSVADREKIWQAMANDHAAIRELMLERYGEDFDKAFF